MGLYLGEKKVTTNFSRQGASGGIKDWDVNDETSPEYIKNRPVYINYNTEGSTLILDKVDMYYSNPLIKDDAYEYGYSTGVDIDGKIYWTDTIMNMGGTYLLKVEDSNNVFYEYEMKKYYDDNGYEVLSLIEGYTPNLSIFTDSLNVIGVSLPINVATSFNNENPKMSLWNRQDGNPFKKLTVKNEYIPVFQSDWNETNESSPSFVKNKPFQDEISAQNIYHITNGYSAQGFTTPTLESTELNQINELIVGEHYMFIINDTTVFDAVATSKTKLSYNSYYTWDIASMHNCNLPTGVLGNLAGGNDFYVPQESKFVIKIKKVVQELKKIDDKYLDLPKPYVIDSEAYTYGDDALQAILEGRQLYVKVPNVDGGSKYSNFMPVLQYQLPNENNDYLTLFYLKDGIANNLVTGLTKMMQGDMSGMANIYGEITMLLSQSYSECPLKVDPVK